MTEEPVVDVATGVHSATGDAVVITTPIQTKPVAAATYPKYSVVEGILTAKNTKGTRHIALSVLRRTQTVQ